MVGPPPAGIEQLRGLTLPGLVNAHSHAFHRALRSRTQAGRGTFWTWRDQMYRLAATLTPESYGRLAAATFAEMAEAGITTVGEFHYLHHQPGGRPYADGNEMGEAIRAAADEAGVRLTLLDTCYLHGGIGAEPNEVQQRFADASAEAWAERVATMADGPTVRIGAAVHSVRAVAPEEMAVVRQWCDERDARRARPRQRAAGRERRLPAPRTAPRRSRCSAAAGLLGERFTAVHATHLTDGDVSALGGSHVCFCPTTERDLADGIGPAAALDRRRRRAVPGLGLARGDRPVRGGPGRGARCPPGHRRAGAPPRGRAAHGGDGRWRAHRSAGPRPVASKRARWRTSRSWPSTRPRTAGAEPGHLVEAAVFAAAAADVRDVMVGGRWVVRDGEHVRMRVGERLAAGIAEVWGEASA